MGRRSPPQMDMQQIMPLTPVVKIIMGINVVIWLLGCVIIEQYFLSTPYLTMGLGLIPYKLLKDFFVWQPITYLFIHDVNPTHIIFNMLLLWWLGSELERLWGSKFFALFYFVSGVGAAFLYTAAVLVYGIVKGNGTVLLDPVIGASAALFGLMVAYGLIFGERVVYFMFFFPMKAKFFIGILGAIEVVMILNNGPGQGKVSHLAHIGGIISGFIFLKYGPGLKVADKVAREAKVGKKRKKARN